MAGGRKSAAESESKPNKKRLFERNSRCQAPWRARASPFLTLMAFLEMPAATGWFIVSMHPETARIICEPSPETHTHTWRVYVCVKPFAMIIDTRENYDFIILTTRYIEKCLRYSILRQRQQRRFVCVLHLCNADAAAVLNFNDSPAPAGIVCVARERERVKVSSKLAAITTSENNTSPIYTAGIRVVDVNVNNANYLGEIVVKSFLSSRTFCHCGSIGLA